MCSDELELSNGSYSAAAAARPFSFFFPAVTSKKKKKKKLTLNHVYHLTLNSLLHFSENILVFCCYCTTVTPPSLPSGVQKRWKIYYALKKS